MEHLYLRDGSVNSNLWKRPIIIWGCGNDGRKLCRLLKEKKVEVFAFCDSNCDLYEKEILGVTVMSSGEALKKVDVNIALAFHQWIDVVDNIKVDETCELFADYLYEENTRGEVKCAVCGSQDCMSSKAHFAPFIIERMFNNKHVKTQLIHCNHCGFWFSLYRPNDIEMIRLYDGYRDEKYVKQRQKYEPQYSLQSFIALESEKARNKRLSDYLQRWIDCSVVYTLLDYGGDKGQYIPELFDRAERYVYEISGNAVREGIVLLRDLSEVQNRKFDFIMCCQVLEHVSNPMEIIEIMINALNKNGFLYIEVPNEFFFKAYSDVEISEHINFFYKDTMMFIAAIMGLRVVNIEMDQSCSAIFMKY